MSPLGGSARRTWFVTGASRGLGAALVGHALAQGDNVVAAARRPETLDRQVDGAERLLPVRLDVTREQDASDAVAAAFEHFGSLDVVVNNAGYALVGALEEVSDRQARAIFDTNVFGVMNVIRAALPVMRGQRAGRIVNIGSMAGYASAPGAGLYCATKFALAGLTEALAAEVAPLGIGVMLVEPGPFRTDFHDDASIVYATSMDAYANTPVAQTRAWVADSNHAQPGDPLKAVALIYEAAIDSAMPARLPIGEVALETLEQTLRGRAAEIEPWRARSLATAYDPG